MDILSPLEAINRVTFAGYLVQSAAEMCCTICEKCPAQGYVLMVGTEEFLVKYQDTRIHWGACRDCIAELGYVVIGDKLRKIETVVKEMNEPYRQAFEDFKSRIRSVK